jgi:hypothetical protein
MRGRRSRRSPPPPLYPRQVANPFSFEFVDWYVSVFGIGIRLLFQIHLKFLNSSFMGFFSSLIFVVWKKNNFLTVRSSTISRIFAFFGILSLRIRI